MRKFRSTVVLSAFLVSVMLAGCGSGKQDGAPAEKKATQKLDAKQMDASKKAEREKIKAASVSNKTSISSKADQLSDVASKKAEPEKKINAYKVTSAMDWSITPDRRAAIEESIPDAKGFIDGTEIVKAIIDGSIVKKEVRVAMFTDKAKDKYVYLAAQTNPNPFNANASLNLIFKEGAFGPDFIMVQLKDPKGFDHKKYLELHGGTGYITAFVGKLSESEGNLVLDPVYDVYLPGFLK